MSIANLSVDQKLFVREAEEAGLTVDYSYSGRMMNGAACPSVSVDSLQSFRTAAKGAQWDSLEQGYVIFCPATFW